MEKKIKGRPRENLWEKYVVGKEESVAEALQKGADLSGVAKLLGCGLTTVNKIKGEYKEKWKDTFGVYFDVANHNVISALYRRAIGLHCEDVFTEVRVDKDGSGQTTFVKKIKKEIPPDTTACIFWLKNRLHNEWSDGKVEDKEGNMFDLSKLSDKEIAQYYRLRSKAAGKVDE